MNAHFFNIIMIAISLIGLTTVTYIAIVRGIMATFLYRLGFVLAGIAELLMDLICQIWIDLRGALRRKTFDRKFPGHQQDPEDIF